MFYNHKIIITDASEIKLAIKCKKKKKIYIYIYIYIYIKNKYIKYNIIYFIY